MEKATLTLTQMHLGAELVWEPKVGTAEHDRFIDAYIPGPHTLQTKRATMSLDFFSTVEATTMPFPFTRTYHASVPAQTSPISLKSFDSFSSVASSPAPSQKAAGTKRSHDGASAPSKRLPGFSIMTRDGVDITENQSRGPKTKEQREHAAKMRKLGACPSCKRRKQKCEPSHHRSSGASGSTAATPMSSSMSARSSIPSLTGPSPSLGSRASISPQSSLESAFAPSPNLMMPAGVAKQDQPWEDGLLSADLLDDEFLIQNPVMDNFVFGQDMFGQNAATGNWDFAAPPMGQDFDLFSYDNTLDFDANLYVNSPSPLLQSSGLSPTCLQQPPQAYQQQSMGSLSPFAYDANGQYLGNENGTAGEYGVAVEFGDTGEYGGLAPDRNGDARATPQKDPEMVTFVKMSSCLTKKQALTIQTTELHSPHSTNGEFASMAGSPKSSLQDSLQSSTHHPVTDGGSQVHQTDGPLRHPRGSRQPSVEPLSPSSPWSSFLDYSGGEVLRRTWATGHQNSLQSGSKNDLHNQQLQNVVNHTDGFIAPVQQSPSVHDGSRQQSSVSALHKVADSSGSAQPPQAGVPSPTLLDTAPTWSPSSAAQDTAPTWNVQAVAGASITPHVTLRKAFKAHKSSRPTIQSSVALSAPTDCGIWTTTNPGSTSSVEVVATISPRISVAVHSDVAKVCHIRTVVNTGVARKAEQEILNEHTAAKTHSLSTSKFLTSDTQSVVATVQKLATAYGLVVSTDAKKPISMFSGFTQTMSSLVNAFRIGFNLGARQGTVQAKSMGRGPGRDLEVAMSGLRLC